MDFCHEFKYLNDEENVFKEIQYEELSQLLDSFGSGLVIIGEVSFIWDNDMESFAATPVDF